MMTKSLGNVIAQPLDHDGTVRGTAKIDNF